MNIELLTIEIRMLRYMHRYPCSVDMLISLLHPKQRWKIGYYLAHLEDLGLVEEISQQEVDAFWRGDNYKEMQTINLPLLLKKAIIARGKEFANKNQKLIEELDEIQ